MTNPMRLASSPVKPVRVSSDAPHRLADLEIVRSLAVARVRIMLGIIDVTDGHLDESAMQILRGECECVLAALDELDIFREATEIPGMEP